MLKRSLVLRRGRFRALAASGVMLGGLVAAGSALMAPAADAATTSATQATACGQVAYFFPQGDALLMTQAGSGLQFLVAAEATASSPTPAGYVYGWYALPGQSFQLSIQSALNASSPTTISSFAVGLGYDYQTGQYTPEVIYSPCTWTADFGTTSGTSSGTTSGTSTGTSSGTDMAGYFGGMAQYQGIMNSVDSDSGAGITADPGGDAGDGGDGD